MRRRAITPARWWGLKAFSIIADRSSVIGLTMECRPDWSFSRILCIDFDRPHRVRIAKVAWHCKNMWPKLPNIDGIEQANGRVVKLLKSLYGLREAQNSGI